MPPSRRQSQRLSRSIASTSSLSADDTSKMVDQSDAQRSAGTKAPSTVRSVYSTSGSAVLSNANCAQLPGSDTDHGSPHFSKAYQLVPLLDDSGHGLQLDLHGAMTKGFVRVHDNWTCYRRNYFELVCSVAGLGAGHLYLLDGRQVTDLHLTVGAVTCDSPAAQTPVVQHTAKRDKGPQMEPSVKLINNDQLDASWERLQFRTATANNGKARDVQQYYRLKITLAGCVTDDQGKQTVIDLATCSSERMIVRGRSPGHYSDGNFPSNRSQSCVIKAEADTAIERVTEWLGDGIASTVPPSSLLSTSTQTRGKPKVRIDTNLLSGDSSRRLNARAEGMQLQPFQPAQTLFQGPFPPSMIGTSSGGARTRLQRSVSFPSGRQMSDPRLTRSMPYLPTMPDSSPSSLISTPYSSMPPSPTSLFRSCASTDGTSEQDATFDAAVSLETLRYKTSHSSSRYSLHRLAPCPETPTDEDSELSIDYKAPNQGQQLPHDRSGLDPLVHLVGPPMTPTPARASTVLLPAMVAAEKSNRSSKEGVQRLEASEALLILQAGKTKT